MIGEKPSNALFVLLLLFSCIPCPPSFGAEPSYESEEQDLEFKRLLDEGLNYFVNEKDYAKAIECFEKALVVKPRDPTARKALRLARDSARNYHCAVVPASVSQSTEPVQGSSVPPGDKQGKSSGWLHFESPSGESKNAGEKARLVSQHYNKGLLDFMNEKYSKTIKEMEAVLKLDPSHAKARKLLMRAYSLQEKKFIDVNLTRYFIEKPLPPGQILYAIAFFPSPLAGEGEDGG